MKGITSNNLASECALKLYERGETEMINRNDPQQFAQFSAHFVSDTDQSQACNFANFVPFGEDNPLQVNLSTLLFYIHKFLTHYFPS